jgi:hypothetical protein
MLLITAPAIWLIFLFTMNSCNRPAADYFVREIDSIAKEYVPDSREGICRARLYIRGSEMILTGETDRKEIKDALTGFLSRKGVTFTDSLAVLPDTSKIMKPWGVVNVSVCNIRSEPSHGAEMVSQAIMGTPVRILKVKGGWLFIQTPDLYLGWVDEEGVEPYTTDDHNKWKKTDRLIYLGGVSTIYGSYDKKEAISDIVAGSILVKSGNSASGFSVILPDGRMGFIEDASCEDFIEWAGNTSPEAENLIKRAYSLMGTPYLWGGTSVKGTDCSGFVKTFYFLNGTILARDVSLMIRHGYEIKSFTDPDSLKPGDLLFFGSVRNGKARATHVGMYVGDTEFIHSSGMVRVNSLDSARTNYSSYRRKTFIGARRIIGSEPQKGIQPVYNHNWYID